MQLKKTFFALWFILLASANCYCQKENFKCRCTKIGLDSIWAVNNRIACYLIPVPKNKSNPSLGKLYLATVLAPSLNNTIEKPLLYLHGGPGIATVENVPRYLQSNTWKRLRENRAILFFDYRGTGFSEPSLCPGMKDALAKFSKINSSTEAAQSYEVSLYKECRAQLLSMGIETSSFNSTQLAEDAEAIRSSLHIANFNVYGVSFGTTVALNLLRNHSTTINSMILDSPFPPNAPWLDFVRPFDTCFAVLEKNISDNAAAKFHFSSIRTEFTNAVKRLNKTPVTIKGNAGSEEYQYYGDDFAWSIWTAMLNPKSIPFVPLVIHEVGNGNDSILPKWTTAFSNPNSFGTFSEQQSKAILCYESRPKTANDTKESLLIKYPDFSSFAIDFEGEICDAWQPQPANNQAFMPVTSKVPVLILSGEYDPVCPPLFGKLTSHTLSNSTFIAIPAASHAAIHADDCIRQIADSFLTNPKAKPNTSCVSNRSQINFVIDNLAKAISEFK